MKNELYIPDSHLRLEERPDGSVRISLSAHLLSLLGSPSFVGISAEPGFCIQPNVPFASVETDKTAYDVALPFRASFVAANPDVVANPAALRGDAQGGGWLCDVRPASGGGWRDGLLDEAAYASYVQP